MISVDLGRPAAVVELARVLRLGVDRSCHHRRDRPWTWCADVTKPERRDERVFVSHTSELATWPSPVSYVRAAQDTIEYANMRPVDMSHFAAEDRPPPSVCEGRVRTC